MSIWQHHWLPRKNPPQVLSPMVESFAEAKVALLINESTRHWNNEMIEGIFTLVEVDMIKAIPFSLCEAEDTLFWPFTNNGIYNSKSGYRFLKVEEQTNWMKSRGWTTNTCGGHFGLCNFLTKLKIWCGGHAATLCQPKRTWCVLLSSTIQSVIGVSRY